MRAGVVGAPVHYVSDEIRRVRGILGIGAVLLAVLAVACGDGGPVAPTAPTPVSAPLSDSWLGWFTSVSTGHKTATMTLFHVGSVVTGFLTLFGPDDSISGNLTGGVVGATALLTFRPTDAARCSMSIVAIVSGTTLEGTWSTLDCGTKDLGTFRLTRQ